MDDLEVQYTISGDSHAEKWSDIARQIESGYRMLTETYKFDSISLEAYMNQVALIDWFPIPYLPRSAEEYLDAEESGFAELVDKFPLEPEVFTDKNRVFRQIMVVYCSELLKAKASLEAGLTENAWWHWSCACYHHGMSQGYFLRTKPADDKRRNGKQGGLAKAEKKRQEVRKACIKHLIKNRPMGGWTSPQAAVDVVAPIVKDSLKKISEELDVDALLYEWLNDDSEVQQAGGFRMR